MNKSCFDNPNRSNGAIREKIHERHPFINSIIISVSDVLDYNYIVFERTESRNDGTGL